MPQNRTLNPGTMFMLQDRKKLEFSGKFDAVWLEPYSIRQTYPNDTIQLATINRT